MTKIVRTPTKATGGVTPDELEKMKAHSDMWIKHIMRTEPADYDQLKAAIEGLYEVSGLKKPRVILVPSPLVMAFAYGASVAILKKYSNATRNATEYATGNATEYATWNATDNATRNATYNATRNATYNATYDATYDATRNATRNVIENQVDQAVQACYTLAGQEGLEYAKKWTSAYQGGAYWASHVCYMTAMRDILNLKLPEFEKYKYWEQAAIHGTFRVMGDDFCIVSDFPEVLKVDDRNRPHCQDGPSHRWRDGWELYYWHGVQVPKEWIMNPGHLTAKMALTWENVEQRRAACEILGWANILKELKAKVIDTDGDPEIGELVEVDLPDIGKEKFLRVLCGTGREFALPVPPDMTSALQAQSWTWGLTPEEFKIPEVRT